MLSVILRYCLSVWQRVSEIYKFHCIKARPMSLLPTALTPSHLLSSYIKKASYIQNRSFLIPLKGWKNKKERKNNFETFFMRLPREKLFPPSHLNLSERKSFFPIDRGKASTSNWHMFPRKFFFFQRLISNELSNHSLFNSHLPRRLSWVVCKVLKGDFIW